LGPCIVKRDFCEKYKPAMSSFLVESSNEHRKANKLKFEPIDKFQGDYADQAGRKLKLIHTSWQVQNPVNLQTDSLIGAKFPGFSSQIACAVTTGCLELGDEGHLPESSHD
jgi:hypothetical protein